MKVPIIMSELMVTILTLVCGVEMVLMVSSGFYAISVQCGVASAIIFVIQMKWLEKACYNYAKLIYTKLGVNSCCLAQKFSLQIFFYLRI